MITKRQFCLMNLKNYSKDEEVKVEEVLANPLAHCLRSSTLAVSLKFLGFLKDHPQVDEYASERGGTVFVWAPYSKEEMEKEGGPAILSVLELIQFLPET